MRSAPGGEHRRTWCERAFLFTRSQFHSFGTTAAPRTCSRQREAGPRRDSVGIGQALHCAGLGGVGAGDSESNPRYLHGTRNVAVPAIAIDSVCSGVACCTGAKLSKRAAPVRVYTAVCNRARWLFAIVAHPSTRGSNIRKRVNTHSP